MTPKKKASKTTKKNRKRKTRQTKPQQKLKQVSLTLSETAATAADPLGACQYTDTSGQIVCIDKVTKTQCSKYNNSNFLAGESCH